VRLAAPQPVRFASAACSPSPFYAARTTPCSWVSRTTRGRASHLEELHQRARQQPRVRPRALPAQQQKRRSARAVRPRLACTAWRVLPHGPCHAQPWQPACWVPGAVREPRPHRSTTHLLHWLSFLYITHKSSKDADLRDNIHKANISRRVRARLHGVRLAGRGDAVGHEHAAVARARHLAHHWRRGGLVEGLLRRVAAEHAREVVRLPAVAVLVPAPAARQRLFCRSLAERERGSLPSERETW